MVVAGGSNGAVQVLRLFEVDRSNDPTEDQIKRLEAAMASNIVKTQATPTLGQG